MADINVNVVLPDPISVDVTSPTQALATNVSVPGPQGPAGPRGFTPLINGVTGDSILFSGQNGIIISSDQSISTIFFSGNSGYFQLAVNNLTTNLESTGSNLYILLTGFSGNLDSNYATDLQLYTTGSTLDTKVNFLSGYINSSSSNILFTTGNQIKSGRLVIGDTILDITNPYTLSLQSNNQDTFLEILNSGGSGKGMFCGINNNDFEQYNWQGGDILFFTAENPSEGYERLRIKNNGKIGIGTSSPSEKLEVNGNVKASGASFDNRPTVNGTGVLLSGEAAGLPTTIVYTTGDQTISGIKTFNVAPVISGNPFITGNLSLYATTINLATTGSTLDIKINNLSGYVNSQDVSISNNLTSTGATLINNLFNTGSTLNTKINDLSGYINTQDTAISNNLRTTGSTLDNKINSLSGSSVLLYGNQSIGGVKTFRDNVYINNLFVTGTETIVSTNNFNVQSPYILLNLTGGAVDGGIFFVTGSGFTGLNDSGPIIGFDHSKSFKFGISTRNSDLSTLPDIASVQQIEAYSGVANNTFSTITNLYNTGSTLDSKINSLSGSAVLLYGNQNINGNKSFYGDILLSGTNNRIGKNHYLQTDSDFVFIKDAGNGLIFSSEEYLFQDINNVTSLEFGGRLLKDSNATTSISWEERYLSNEVGALVLTWTGDNIGIGTNTPSEKLEVNGNIKFGDVINGYSAKFIMWDPANAVYNTGDWYDSQLTLTDSANNKSIALNFYGDTNSLISNGSILRLPSGKDDFIAMDSEVVHKTGNEIISGTKIFNENISGAFISGTYINAGLTSAWDSGPRNGYFLGNGHSIRAVDTSNGIGFYSASNAYPRFLMAASTLRMGANGALLWNSTNDVVTPTSTTDVGIYRDAANILAQRNGTNAQQLRIYNSTGINSGEFGLFGWQNNELVIGARNTNSGILRSLVITGDSISYSGKILTIAHANAGFFMDATGPTIRGNHWGAGDAGFIKYRNGLDLGRGGSTYLKVDSSTPVVVVGRGTNTAGVVGVGFDGTNSALSSPDAFIIRDGAGILSLRNPITNNSPQQLRIFNISGTNTGEFGVFGWINSGLVIGPQQTNSGILRNIVITGSNINLSSTGNITIDRNSQIIFPSRFGTTSIPNRLYTDSPTDTNNNYYFYGGNGGGNFVFNNQDGNWNLVLGTAGAIGFSQQSSAQRGAFSPDVLLYRDAANTLALRNGTTSQQFRAYNTTGTNSGEFGLFGWQNNNLIIGSQATNSGILRNTILTGVTDIFGPPIQNINISASNSGVVGGAGDMTPNNITLTAGTGRVIFTNAPRYGTIGLIGNIDINNISSPLVAKTITIYKTGLSSMFLPSAIPAVTIDNDWFSINTPINSTQAGLGFRISGVAVTPAIYVNTTSNQTINGLKTFTSGIDIYSGTSSQSIRVFNRTGTNSGEFGLVGWTNNSLVVGPQQTNSGVLRDLTLTGNNININASGVFNIFDNTNIVGNLTVSGNTTITGHLSAASKSFLIDHPTQAGKKLQYGSLESPYHGIRLTDKNKISADSVQVNLPDYISALVNEDKVNVQLTNINHDKVLFVKEINVNQNNFIVGINRGWFDKNEYEFYWSFTAERKDIPKLTVEF
jgi:hypothetical protein